MGLGFSHGDAGWSYSGFHRFRRRLAMAALGIDLDKMRGFVALGEGRSWTKLNDDPITLLLNHSDCDGELSPSECHLIAPRLREIVSVWSDDYDRHHALLLAQGMEQAANAGVPLEFC